MADTVSQDPVLTQEVNEKIALLTLNRPARRNAANDALIKALGDFFSSPPKEVRVAVLCGAGGHFCAGLDLAEHEYRTPVDTVSHSRNWQYVMDLIEFGGLPVVSVLNGAVIGGGLEIAAATHIRIAGSSARFQLPEGRRGIFVGGGASVRVGRLIGADRMREMMLTGRIYGAQEAVHLGLAHYTEDQGKALEKAYEIAGQIAGNAPFCNRLILEALHILQICRAGRVCGAKALPPPWRRLPLMRARDCVPFWRKESRNFAISCNARPWSVAGEYGTDRHLVPELPIAYPLPDHIPLARSFD